MSWLVVVNEKMKRRYLQARKKMRTKHRAAKELILACVLVRIIPWKQLGVLWLRGLIKLGFNLVRWAGGGAQIWALGVPIWWKIDGNN